MLRVTETFIEKENNVDQMYRFELHSSVKTAKDDFEFKEWEIGLTKLVENSPAIILGAAWSVVVDDSEWRFQVVSNQTEVRSIQNNTEEVSRIISRNPEEYLKRLNEILKITPISNQVFGLKFVQLVVEILANLRTLIELDDGIDISPEMSQAMFRHIHNLTGGASLDVKHPTVEKDESVVWALLLVRSWNDGIPNT